MKDKDKEASVYDLHNSETEEMYVGSTKDPIDREKKHLCALRNNRHVNYQLQKAFNKNPNFEFSYVAVGDRELALDVEQEILDKNFDSPLLLNLARDARYCNLGIPVSAEAKAKISAALKGRSISQEHLEKLKQKRLTPEQKEHLRLINTGKKLTDEHKQKMSVASRERFKDPEVSARLINSRIGKPLTDERKQKLSQAVKGRKDSPEVIEKKKLAQLQNSKGVIIDGVEYISRTKAAEALGVTKTTISNRVITGKYKEF